MLRSQRLASRIRTGARILTGAFIVCLANEGRADTYSVGAGTGCTHASVAAAIAAAESHAGDDTIRVTRSVDYSQQALLVGTTQNLEITGGFASCAQTSNDGVATVIDGAGGATDPVLRITGGGEGVIRLRNLTVRGGDEDGSGEGGGILYRGRGTLDIADVTISSNVAGYGGGVYAEGTAGGARLVLGANVLVVSNSARYSGGGIYVEGMRLEMTGENVLIAFNHALAEGGQGGYGGGLMLLGTDHTAFADIRTTGQGGLGVLYSNDARYGGGAALVAPDDRDGYVLLRLASPDPQRPTGIRGNFASVAGGAIYARPDIEVGSILVEQHPAQIQLANCELTDNAAPDGAAVYLDSDSSVFGFEAGAELRINDSFAFPFSCATGAPCGRISGNDAHDGVQPTAGATIRLRDGARFTAGAGPSVSQLENHGIAMQDNRGGRLVYASEDATVSLASILMSGNQVSAELLRFAGEDDSHTELRGVTIAGNPIGAAHVIDKFDETVIKDSIIWQPGKTTLHDDGGTLEVQTVIASEVISLDAGPEAIVAEPRFVDPARSDFSLRAASPAVDAAIATGPADRDINGLPRNVDLGIVANSRGPRDIGAFERQALDPLVLNGDLDADANLWTQSVPGLGSWDGSQNASGASGSGSLKLEQAGTPNLQRVYGMSQCIHLPGPGVYALNGWGRAGAGGTGNRDYVYLHWELRRFGGEACNQGPADAAGDHFLSNSSNWQHPANPSLIVAPAADWTYTSSILVTHVVNEFGTTSPSNTIGWADGITLTVSGDDTLFRAGFDP